MRREQQARGVAAWRDCTAETAGDAQGAAELAEQAAASQATSGDARREARTAGVRLDFAGARLDFAVVGSSGGWQRGRWRGSAGGGGRRRRRGRRRPAAPARAAAARRWRRQRRGDDDGVSAAATSARQRQRRGKRRDGLSDRSEARIDECRRRD
ncbi:hypothetical protein Syun_020984 [Stephania yunnanensis]|uniref:Uncharacterized protein n=1 Tax=Stephania yunnanensis TaxID=152371 RepID=A0AAP0NNR2_9MAGN